MNGYYEGRISSIDAAAGFVRVTYPEYQGTVSNWLRLLNFEYNIPKIGALVGTIIDDNGDGICLGTIFSYGQPPAVAEGYYKDMEGVEVAKNGDGFYIKFNNTNYIHYSNGTMTIRADNVNIINNLDN